MKKPGYLTDFSTIGRQVKDSKVTGDDIDEFDVIIVGGGGFSSSSFAFGIHISSWSATIRNRWVRFGFTPKRSCLYPSSTSGIGGKVSIPHTPIRRTFKNIFEVAKACYSPEFLRHFLFCSILNMPTRCTLNHKHSLVGKRNFGPEVGRSFNACHIEMYLRQHLCSSQEKCLEDVSSR